ncbi:hypothetical protein AB9K26_03725, partial [Psychroserpens sp. XS_ASV72]|uniref:hypothetical protein n=1 Tax=Psychroserpens sp. XS_ASV72 TaxID=3241293 RepID=UPI0035131CF8
MKKKALLFIAICTSLLSFSQSSELVFLKLGISSGGNSYNTDVYFNPNATRGFDLGYDAQFVFEIPSFAIYSYLVDGNLTDPYALQAVNTLDLADITIPIGITASQGQTITFSLLVNQLPETTEIYLDDLVADTSIDIKATNYILTLDSPQSGAGRFYLRVSDSTLITNYVFDGTWSPNDPNGVATSNDTITIESGNATINSNTTCNSLIVNPGAGLIVNTGINLEITNGVTLESTSTTYSSLILDGTVGGTINYERHVNINGTGSTGSNDLVSAPLSGQAFSDFAAANPNLFDNGAGTLFLFGPFDKSTGDFVTYANTETATLGGDGVGYRAATDDNGTLTFTGTAESGTVANDIQNSGPIRQEWNLVGNPYPSYMNVQTFLTHDVGGTTNLALFEPASAAIYGYDGSATNGWTIYNLATTTPSTVMAPGQGFFVSANAANVGPYDLEFSPDIRSTGTSDDFIVGRNAQLTYMVLDINTTNKAFSTDFYFNPNASQGFDLGYDAAVWGDGAPEFAVYSHLVQDNTGVAMALQALNGSDLADVTIPLGVNANQGEQLTFSISDSTLPASVEVYLEDTVANTLTLLNDSDYVI